MDKEFVLLQNIVDENEFEFKDVVDFNLRKYCHEIFFEIFRRTRRFEEIKAKSKLSKTFRFKIKKA